MRSQHGPRRPLRLAAAAAAIFGFGLAAIALVRIAGRDAVPTDGAPEVRAAGASAGNVRAALEAAERYLDSGELPKAEAILGRLIDRAPREVGAHELLGRVLIRKGAEADARGRAADAAAARAGAWEHYRTAASLDPRSGGLQHSAGVVASMAGEEKAALRRFENATRLDPAKPQYPLYAAQLLMRQGALDEATARLERVLELDPDEPLAHASLARIALDGGRYDAALAAVREAREIIPADLRFRVLEAQIHRRRGDPRRAIELLAALPARERATPGPSFELAASYAEAGDHAAAARVWEARYRSDPGGAEAWRAAVRAADAWIRAGNRDEARAWLDMARLHAGDAPEIRKLEAELAAGG